MDRLIFFVSEQTKHYILFLRYVNWRSLFFEKLENISTTCITIRALFLQAIVRICSHSGPKRFSPNYKFGLHYFKILTQGLMSPTLGLSWRVCVLRYVTLGVLKLITLDRLGQSSLLRNCIIFKRSVLTLVLWLRPHPKFPTATTFYRFSLLNLVS